INYRDERSGQQLAISGIELSSGRIADGASGKLTLAATAKGSQPAIDGSLKLDAGYRMNGPVIALEGISADVVVAAPHLPQKTLRTNLSGSASFDRDKGSFSADLGAKVDESTIKAKLAHAPLSFDVAIDRLDLDRYMPPKV